MKYIQILLIIILLYIIYIIQNKVNTNNNIKEDFRQLKEYYRSCFRKTRIEFENMINNIYDINLITNKLKKWKII